jgi:hypothetical protein
VAEPPKPERQFGSSDISKTSELGGGITDSRLVEYENGDIGVYKDLSDAQGYHNGNSEVAAYELSELLGMEIVPETAFTDSVIEGNRGTVQRFIDDAILGDSIPIGSLSKEVKERMLALDIITFNADRHEGNYLRDPVGKIWAIDHGHSQWLPWEGSNKAVMWNSAITERASSGSFEWSAETREKWSQIDRETFMGSLSGVQLQPEAKEAAWGNLQYIIKNGDVSW